MLRTSDRAIAALFVLLAQVSHARAERPREPVAPSAPVATQPAAPPGYDDAVSRGFRAFEEGRYADARAGFMDAHALYPNARTLRALGKAEYELSHYVAALAYLEDALRSDERPLTPEQRAEAEELCDQLRGFVAHLRVTVRPAGAQLLLDGAPAVERPEGGVLVTEGPHDIEARAPGYVTQKRSVHVIGGGDTQVDMLLMAAAPEQPHDDASKSHGRRKLWAWVAVGGVVVAGAVTAGILAASRGGGTQGIASGTTGEVIRIPAASP